MPGAPKEPAGPPAVETAPLTPVQAGNSSAVLPAASFLGMLIVGYLARHSKATREHGLRTVAV